MLDIVAHLTKGYKAHKNLDMVQIIIFPNLMGMEHPFGLPTKLTFMSSLIKNVIPDPSPPGHAQEVSQVLFPTRLRHHFDCKFQFFLFCHCLKIPILQALSQKG
jgi:hypothetical protein